MRAGGIVVNGMSNQARDEANANSAVLVTVGPEDFAGSHPLAEHYLSAKLEQSFG